ncbi:NAD-dependent epimerase dehydratase, putative [Babesia ovis]|uniref:NAD-dependent epimerase dehydratase, putative n=1 Tax=Babesia ovis TaxID=5869 RepID=A0A9W5WV20_BABOV|nr:NAD-dependent epimerase dehydratase, putative [Babesia ovis]
MDAAERAKYCRERLEALRLDLPRIATVLKGADEQLERRRGKAGIPSSVSQIRIAMLEASIERLREAQRNVAPVVEGAMKLLESIEAVASSAAATRRQLASVQKNIAHVEMERLSAQIALTEKRLLALNRLMSHLSPSMSSVNHDFLASEAHMLPTTVDGMERILETAESLLASKAFCDSLQEMEFLKGSAVLLEATQRLSTSLDSICEISFLWIQRESRLLSISLCALFNDASAVALRHSHAFVPPSTGTQKLPDDLGMRSVIEHSGPQNETSEVPVALRVLKLLKMRPTYLYHFLAGMRDILGQVSLKRFSAYTRALKVDAYKRSVSVASLLNHLQSNVKFMKKCVENLYNNAGIPLHDPDLRWHEIIFPTAERYLRHILKWLVIPLETKLNHLMQDNIVTGVEGILNCYTIVDMFDAIQTVKSHINKLESELKIPWVCHTASSGIDIDGLDEPKGKSRSITKEDPSATLPDNNAANLDNEENKQNIPSSGEDIPDDIPCGDDNPDQPGLTRGTTEFAIDCATQRTEDENDIKYDYAMGDDPNDTEDPLITKLQAVHSEWRDRLFEEFKLRIENPLTVGDIYDLGPLSTVDIAAPHLVNTIAEFITEITKVQSQHDSSEDFVVILEKTLGPTLNWCHRSSEKYGENASAYLINCYAVLMRALSKAVVPTFLTCELDRNLQTHMDSIVQSLLRDLEALLQLDEAMSNVGTRDAVLKRISAFIYGDGLMACDFDSTKRLKLITDDYQTTIRTRVYRLLADEYTRLAGEDGSYQPHELQEFVSQL